MTMMPSIPERMSNSSMGDLTGDESLLRALKRSNSLSRDGGGKEDAPLVEGCIPKGSMEPEACGMTGEPPQGEACEGVGLVLDQTPTVWWQWDLKDDVVIAF